MPTNRSFPQRGDLILMKHASSGALSSSGSLALVAIQWPRVKAKPSSSMVSRSIRLAPCGTPAWQKAGRPTTPCSNRQIRARRIVVGHGYPHTYSDSKAIEMFPKLEHRFWSKNCAFKVSAGEVRSVSNNRHCDKLWGWPASSITLPDMLHWARPILGTFLIRLF